MSLMKCVNGVNVPMSPEEEAATLADWAATAATPQPPKTLSDGQLANALVKAGVITQAQVDAAISAIPK